jgi:hypothetical protein
MPREFDWTAALDTFGVHGLAQIEKVRALMAAAGIHGLPLHPLEEYEVKQLRERAANNLAAAAAIEARAVTDG